MLGELKLEEVGPGPRLSFSFGPRLNLLTGDNGLGKSFVLELAWWALTDNGVDPVPALPRAGRQGKVTYSLVTEMGRTPELEYPVHGDGRPVGGYKRPAPLHSALILHARVDGGFRVWDPVRNDFLRTYEGAGRPRFYDFSQDSLWDGLVEDGRVLCNGLIRDWVYWQLRRSESFELLCKVLARLSPDAAETLKPGEPTRLGVDDARDIPTLEMPYGSVPITQASAGIRRIVGLAYLLVWAWEEHRRVAELLQRKATDHIVLLIDEVESHLHPRWQRLILPSLLAVVRELRPDVKVQVIAVTHAPLVLASVEPQFDPDQDALFMFDLVGNEVKVTKADWRPRGDANAWLTSEVFDLKEPRSVEAEEAITRARAALKDPHLPIEEVKRIHNDLYRLLRDTDPFWPRWLARAEAAGIEP
ncbi:AAA family ATPase [Vitiosangium sp. GDMCC 1.1324]|uniref:AAA family ATPase n=1 Tax=Vitiosangium sp. (strain GDMCC 1.1324) TaxID=2138576 RepID=UPI000D373994|nr:AAA family ATPase [Vitiosangium sp. GDMCC 1.1324]PTL84737.1 ATPase [Vitiosangium sp. GDMCC 1.1324]